MTDSASALESLLLVQSVASYGTTNDAFNQIAESFKTSDLLQSTTSVNSDRYNAHSLTENYLHLLKKEAKTAQQNSSAGSDGPIRSPQMATVEDAAAYIHLIPQLIARLYEQYKDLIISEIRECEREYDALVKQETVSAQNTKAQPDNQTKENSTGDEPTRRQDEGNEVGIDKAQDREGLGKDVQPKQAHTEQTVKAVESKPVSETPSAPLQPTATDLSGQSSNVKVSIPSSSVNSLIESGSSAQAVQVTSAPTTQQVQTNATRPNESLIDQVQPRYLPSQPPLIHHRQPSHDQPIRQLGENPSIPFQPSYPPRWLPPVYTSPYRTQPASPSYPAQLPTTSIQSQPRRSGGVQLPPFSINPQVSTPTSTSNKQSAAPQLSALKVPQDQTRNSTPSAKPAPSSETPSTISAPAQPPSVTNLVTQKIDVHFSPGSSTGWKGPFTGEKTRPRSVSPISDTESDAKRPTTKGGSRRKKITVGSTSRDAQSNRASRGSSKTPSVAGASSHARTRSQSVTSIADDASIASHHSSSKLKREVGTPTPGERASSRPTRSNVASTSTTITTVKRKRGDSTTDLQPPTSRLASPTPTLSSGPQQLSAQKPSTITASRNFNKMTAPLMDHIASHKHASLFANPVPARTQGYYDMVRRPTDLKTIKSQIAAGQKAITAATSASSASGSVSSPGVLNRSGTPSQSDSATTVTLPYSDDLVPPKAIVNAAQLEQELLRMFANAVMFNEGDDGVVADTREMFNEIEKSIAQWRDAESGWQDISSFDDTGGGGSGGAGTPTTGLGGGMAPSSKRRRA